MKKIMLSLALTVLSAAVSMLSAEDFMRVRYALSFNDSRYIAQFVPGNSYLKEYGTSYMYSDAAFATVINNARHEMLPYAKVYQNTYYGNIVDGVAGHGIKVELPNLNSGIAYKLRLHTVEFYYNWDPGRNFRVHINDTLMEAPRDGTFNCWRDAGFHVPHYYDIPNCYANDEGVMNIFLENINDKLVICGLELYEPTNAPCYKPGLQVKGYQEFACIIPETTYHRSSTVLYDIEYRDGGEGSQVKTLSRVWGGFVYDTTPADEGAYREYRVRMSQGNNDLWSDWVSAGGRTLSALTDDEGKTLLPVPAEQYEKTGVVSVFHKNASDDDATAADEEAVEGTLTKDVLSWTQADVPESCTGDGTPVRILTSGKIFFPYMADGCKIVVKGNGLVNLWLDEGWMKTSLINGGVVTNEFKYLKYSGNMTGSKNSHARDRSYTNQCYGVGGVHDFYVEQLQKPGEDISTSVEFIDDEGKPIPMSLYASDFTADISPWKYHQLHARQWQYRADTYALPLDEERTSFRIYGSGDNTWGGVDGGSLLYQCLKGPFEMKMRIKSISDVYDMNCRFGFSMRGGLGNQAEDKFLILAGYNSRSGISPRLFWDADLSDGMNITSPFGSDGKYKKYPVWLKLVNTAGVNEKNERVFNFEFYFSEDGENWGSPFAKGSVPRSKNVYTGPIVVASSLLGTSTPWMEIDNLELIDTSVMPVLIIIR